MSNQTRPITNICIAGAPPDASDLGVSALGHAVIAALARHGIKDICVLDQGDSLRQSSVITPAGPTPVTLLGAVDDNRFLEPSNLWNIRLSAKLGGLANPIARYLRSAAAVLDLSGSHGLTDAHGSAGFTASCLPKLTAIESGVPLLLLAQPIGPFADPSLREKARHIARAATQVWAQDSESLASLRDLLGPGFNPQTHRQGIDLSFGLEPMSTGSVPQWFSLWKHSHPAKPIIGLSVDASLYASLQARQTLGLASEHAQLIRFILRWFLNHTNANVMLVPQIISTPAGISGDVVASHDLLTWLHSYEASRVRVLDSVTHPGIAKWFIGQCDWFVGSRLFGALAAISQSVPTAALVHDARPAAALAPFASRPIAIDLRHHDRESVLGQLVHSWCNRHKTREEMAQPVRDAHTRWQQHITDILSFQPSLTQETPAPTHTA